jgi:Stigma-specific protein, Stig1
VPEISTMDSESVGDFAFRHSCVKVASWISAAALWLTLLTGCTESGITGMGEDASDSSTNSGEETVDTRSDSPADGAPLEGGEEVLTVGGDSGDASLDARADGDATVVAALMDATVDVSTLDATVDASDAARDVGQEDDGPEPDVGASPESAPAEGGAPGEAGVPACGATPSCPAGTVSCGFGCAPNAWYGSLCDRGSCSLCSLPHAVAACADGGGKCAIDHCVDGYADCDGNPDNGCEADLSSVATCGGCSACGAGQVCTKRSCQNACLPGEQSCGATSCANLASDPRNCGGCGQVCPLGDNNLNAPTCVNGNCVVNCTGSSVSCSGSCVELATNVSNCGSCGHACAVPTGGVALCAAGQCYTSCPAGQAACGSACVVTDVDSKNCGGCGNTCASTQTCVRGACATLQSYSWIWQGSTVPEDIAVDDTNVYFTDPAGQTVNRMPKAGGMVTPLATGQAKPLRLAIDSTHVYWTASLGAAIWRAPKDGSAPASFFEAASGPYGIAVAGGYVYWTNTAADANGMLTVQKVATSGGTPSAIFSSKPSDSQPMDMTSNGTVVLFVVANGKIFRADGNGLLSVGVVGLFQSIATDATSYYVEDGTLARGLTRFDTLTNAVLQPGYQVWPGLGSGFVMNTGAGDSCAVYLQGLAAGVGCWTPGTGIFMLAHASACPVLIAPTKHANRVAADGAYVYWTDGSGAIGRVQVPH